MPRADVQAWLLPVDGSGPFSFDACWARLSPGERDRAAGYVRDEDRRQFVAARGALRHLLGQILDRDGGALELSSPVGGPPRLADGPRHLSFSVAHSGDRVACAIGWRPVGVDVEARGGPADDLLVARTCSRREQDLLGGLDARERDATFLRLWVRKEAVAKALGTGMPADPGDLDVSARRVRGTPGRATWLVRDLVTEPGYVAAVAARGRWWRVRQNAFSARPPTPDVG